MGPDHDRVHRCASQLLGHVLLGANHFYWEDQDHGEQIGEHWLLSKTGFFDGSYHLPCIIRDPRPSADGSRGTAVTEYTEAVDVLPTVCEAFGLEVPPATDGRSLAPFFASGDAPQGWKDAAHWEFYFHGDGERLGQNPHDCSLCVLRGPRYKFVQFAVPGWPPVLCKHSPLPCPVGFCAGVLTPDADR